MRREEASCVSSLLESMADLSCKRSRMAGVARQPSLLKAIAKTIGRLIAVSMIKCPPWRRILMSKKSYSVHWEDAEPTSFEVDGRRHTVHMTEGSSAPAHEVGDEVTVLYNPDRPLEARIQSFGSSALMWIWPGMTGILGLAFLGAVIVVRKLMTPAEGPQNELA
jgi:hypothetical protein